MPTAATMQSTAGGTSANGRGKSQAVVPTVPFIRASALHRESTGIDVSRQLTTSDQDLGVFDIPAYGYVRSLFIVVTASGGTGGAPAATFPEDSPFSTLKNIYVTEPNGAVIYQANTGYEAHLIHKWGGYRFAPGADFKASPTYTAPGATFASYSYCQRIPIELNLRDGLGALPNQNAAAVFKLRLTLAKAADIAAGTLPTTLPTVRVRVYLEAYDQPETASAGQTNQINPPALNTTQFWSSQTYNVSAGQQTIRLTRVGNYIRNLILINRRAGTSRANGDADMPDPTTLYLDTRALDIIERNNWKHQMAERTGFGMAHGSATVTNDGPQALDNGVFLYDFTSEFDGSLGMENRDLWLPTLGSTRLELQGSWANAGTLTVLTNDVAIAGNVFM